MANLLGERLRAYRQARGLTLGALALRTGLATSTLSRWESGAFQPGMAELEATLTALDVSTTERLSLLPLVKAPRTVYRLRHISGEFPPASGDLLRAMRLRKGWTQEQTARQAGVSQATLARWERTEIWPKALHLHTLCTVLDAREPEIVVLTAGPVLQTPPLPLTADSVPLLNSRFFPFRWLSQKAQETSLTDLHYLLFETQAWTLAAADLPGAANLLGRIRAHYATELVFQQRYDQAESVARRILESPVCTLFDPDVRYYAEMTQVQCAVFGQGTPTPRRGLTLLREWLPQCPHPEFVAWMLREIAECAALEQDMETALRVSTHAIRVARRVPNPSEVRLRERDHSLLLLRAGRPDEAFSLSTLQAQDPPDWRITTLLLYSETLLGQGNHSACDEWLQSAYLTMSTSGETSLRPRADAIAQRLASH